MPHPIVTFLVRTYDTANLPKMATRVSRALNLHFSIARSSKWEEIEALEAHTLGITINLYAWPLPEQKEEKIRYHLRGYADSDVALEFTRLVNVSEFIAALLNARDSSEWYVPNLDELKRDVMLENDVSLEDRIEDEDNT